MDIKKIDKNQVLVVVAVVLVAITALLIFANISNNPAFSFLKKFGFGMSRDTVVKNSIDYLNKSVLQSGQVATVNSISEESGLIKVNLKITSTEGGKDYDSYISRDGKLFFPDVIVLSGKPSNQTTQNTEPTKQTCESLAKVEKPMLEVHVVSQCPYGLQVQRAMDNAIANIPSLAQHIKVRYMGDIVNGNITSMHGDAEAQENLRQLCIRDEQPTKYWPYVSCYMKKGDGAGCQVSEKVNGTTLNACIKDSKRGLAYAAEDFALAEKLNDTPDCKANPNNCAVSGSPSLILNGSRVSEFDFGGRSSEAIKTLISCSSATTPGFASEKLNTEAAATSFSTTYGGTGSSSNNAANCAPATN